MRTYFLRDGVIHKIDKSTGGFICGIEKKDSDTYTSVIASGNSMCENCFPVKFARLTWEVASIGEDDGTK